MSTTLDPIIQQKLTAFARRRRRLIVVRGIFAALAMLLLTMLVVAAVDFCAPTYFQVFLPEWVRWTLSGIAYTAVLVIAWRQCLTWLLHAPDAKQLARLIEHAEPKLREDLLSAVELGSAKGEVFDSEQFRALVQEDVAHRMENLEMKSLLPVSLIRRVLGYAAVVVVWVAVLAFVTNGQLGTLLLRALAPMANLDNVSMTKVAVVEVSFEDQKVEAPVPDSVAIPNGATARVVIQLSGERANKAMLESETGDGGGQVIEMTPVGKDTFAATINVQRESVRYRIKAGDALTRRYVLDARERPVITQFEKTYHFPKYTKLADKTVTEPDGALVALEGTEVDVKLKPNQPVKTAELRLEQGKNSSVIALTPALDGTLSARVALNASGSYRVHLVAAETGFANKFSPENELRAEPDLVPSVELTEPKADLILPNNELVDLLGLASDDLALAKVAQLVKVNDGPWKETVILKDNIGPKARVEHRWDLYELSAKPGDLLTTKLVATDLKGNRGESRPLQITVTAAGFELRRLQALESLRALNMTTRALYAQTESLAKTAQKTRDDFNGTDNADTRRQAVVAATGALGEFGTKFTEAWTSLGAALRESPAGHTSAELVMLGREMSRLDIAGARTAAAGLALLNANSQLGGAKELMAEAADALARAQHRAQMAMLAMEAFTTAEEAAALAENGQVVSREQDRLMQLASASGGDAKKWQPLVTRLRVALTQTKAIEDLLAPISERRGSQMLDRAKQVMGSLSKRRVKLEQALTAGEPSAKLLLEPTLDMTRGLKESARQFSDWHRELGWRPVEMVQKIAEDVGPAYSNVSKLPQEIATVRANKNLAPDTQTALLDTRWTLRGEALKAHGDIEEIRATADNQFVGDLRVATSALQALHAVAPGTEQAAMDAKLTEMDRAMRILESGHNLQEAFDGFNHLATNERWDIRSLAARTQSPRDWKWLESRMRALPEEMGKAAQVFQQTSEKVKLVFESYDLADGNREASKFSIKVDGGKSQLVKIGETISGRFKVIDLLQKLVATPEGQRDFFELKVADSVTGKDERLPLGEAKEIGSSEADVRKAFDGAMQILWKAQQMGAWRGISQEMEQRGNVDRLPASAKADAELLAGQVKLALDLLRKHMDDARKRMANISPSISELAAALAKEQEEIKKETAEQAQKAEQQKPEEAKAEAQEQLAAQQKLDAKIETLKDLIRAEANKQSILDKEQREAMRDADDALALLKDPPPKAEQALTDATNDAQAQQKADLERANEQQKKIEDALKMIAEHFEAVEQGKSVAETREALREAEKELGIKEELDQQFAKAQQLAEMAQKDPAALLAELEAKLAENPLMQKELSDIAKDALANAEQKLAQAANTEKNVAEQVAQQAKQAANPQAAKTAMEAAKQAVEAAKAAEKSAEVAEKLAEATGNKEGDKLADQAQDLAHDAVQAAEKAVEAAEKMAKAGNAEQAAKAAEKVMEKAGEAAQQAQKAVESAKQAQASAQEAAKQGGEQQAKNSESAQKAGEAAQQAQKAADAAKEAQALAQQAKAMAENPQTAANPQPNAQTPQQAAKSAAENAEAAAEKAAMAAKAAQKAAESAEAQANAAENPAAAQQADAAGNEAAKAAAEAQSAADAAEMAAKSGSPQEAMKAAQQAAQKAGQAAQAAEKAANAAQQAEQSSQQAAQQGGENQGENQEAAKQSGEAKAQAQAAAQAAKQAQAMAQQAAQQAQAAAQQNQQLANAAQQQPAIAQNAGEAAADVERAGRHEMRLGNQTGQQLQQLGKEIAETAQSDVPAAQQALAQAQQAAQAAPAVQQAAGELAQELAALQNAAQGNPPQGAQPPQAGQPPQGQPPQGAQAGQPPQGAPPAGQPPGEQGAGAPPPQGSPAGTPPSGQPGGEPPQGGQPAQGEPASPAEQQAMARALDALDQQLNGQPANAQAGQPGQPAQGEPAQGQPGEQPGQPGQPGQPSPAQGALAQAAQAAQAAMRQGRAEQGMAQQPGNPLSQSQSAKSEGGATAQAGKLDYKLATDAANLKRGEWGKLPKKLADQLTKGQQEAVAGDYRQAVEAYYKVIAEKAKERK